VYISGILWQALAYHTSPEGDALCLLSIVLGHQITRLPFSEIALPGTGHPFLVDPTHRHCFPILARGPRNLAIDFYSWSPSGRFSLPAGSPPRDFLIIHPPLARHSDCPVCPVYQRCCRWPSPVESTFLRSRPFGRYQKALSLLCAPSDLDSPFLGDRFYHRWHSSNGRFLMTVRFSPSSFFLSFFVF